jgi:hypothetical protein
MSFLAVLTPETEKWVKDNLITEPWQMTGNIIGIDHHYIEDIVEGMIEDGLELNRDFNLV